MKDKSRRSFDKVFKLMVVELHKSGKSSKEIGGEFGISGDKVGPLKPRICINWKTSFFGQRKTNFNF